MLLKQFLVVGNICQNRKKSNFSGSQIVSKLIVPLPQIRYHTEPHEYSYYPCKKIWSASTGSGNKGVITIDTYYVTQCMQKPIILTTTKSIHAETNIFNHNAL
jgi:hypothetical protein